MISRELPHQTAWAGWRRDRDWLEQRDRTAATWILEQAKGVGSRVIIQGTSHAHTYLQGDGPIARLARAGKVATYRSPVASGPTFAPDVDVRLLATAMHTASGHNLVATENPTFPLRGWAMATGALNLETGKITEDLRTAEQNDVLESFVDQLYNGWAHKHVGRRASAYYLPKLAESGMTYNVFVGSLLALDPGHLDSNRDIEEMYRALPAAWTEQRAALRNAWRT